MDGPPAALAGSTVTSVWADWRPPVPVTTRENEYASGAEVELAGTLTFWLNVPLPQGPVMGSPEIAGLAESVHDIAFDIAADTTTGPPPDGTVGGLTEMVLTTGGGVASTSTVTSEAVAPPGPVAVRVTTYGSIPADELAGKVITWEKLPPVQVTAAGSPTTAGVTDNAHVVALPVDAVIEELPPEGGSTSGLDPNAPIVGADVPGAASTDTA
jgi:hypothetical protein